MREVNKKELVTVTDSVELCGNRSTNYQPMCSCRFSEDGFRIHFSRQRACKRWVKLTLAGRRVKIYQREDKSDFPQGTPIVSSLPNHLKYYVAPLPPHRNWPFLNHGRVMLKMTRKLTIIKITLFYFTFKYTKLANGFLIVVKLMFYHCWLLLSFSFMCFLFNWEKSNIIGKGLNLIILPPQLWINSRTDCAL